MNKIAASLSALVASAGLLTTATSAQASLLGGFSITPLPQPGGSSGLILEGTGVSVPNPGGVPNPIFVTNFDFVTPGGAGNQLGDPHSFLTPDDFGDGGIVEVGSQTINGNNDFAPFIAWQGVAL
ncbi:MAG: hypothetical protein WBM62_19260, partial [Crocosphaera sp.]